MKLADRFYQRLGLDSAETHKFSERAAYEMRSIRVAQAVANILPMAISNICFSTVIAWWFWGRGADFQLGIWAAFLLTLNIAALFKHYRRDKSRPVSGSMRAFKAITQQSIVLSILYGIAPFFLIPIAVGADAAIISGMAASALIIGPYIVHSVPKAALAWLVISSVLNTVSFLILGDGGYTIAALFGLVIAGGVGQAVLTQSARITTQFTAQQSLKEKQDVIALLLKEHEENAGAWVWECSAEGVMTRMPPQLIELLFGKNFEHQGPLSVFDFAHLSLNANPLDVELKFTDLLGRPRAFHDLVFLVRSADPADKEGRWLTVRGKPSDDISGDFNGYRGIVSDITEAKLAEDKIRFMAGHDPLTELANRITFGEGLQPWIDKQVPFATLHMDLDRFKLVNDTMGHLAGDELLVAVAERIKAVSLESHADAIVARIGGDEFVVALPLGDGPVEGAVDAAPAEAVAQNIVHALAEPFELEAGTANIGASVGYVVYPDDAKNPSDMPARADLALYRAKNEGRGRCARYTEGMDQRAHDRKRIEMDLKTALQKDQMRVVYQPVVDLDTGTVSGVEALLRWEHPHYGAINPDRFIPMAEDNGQILEIGEWVLEQACEEAATWSRPLSIAVNVSAKQILRQDFVPMVLQILAGAHLPPERLELELTESILVQDADTALKAIRHLRKLGVSVVLDDFGTGYSSLSYLRDFAFDKIKIDKSFIASLSDEDANDPQGAATLVTAIVSLAQTLGMRITAEGIEIESQAEELRDMGCNIGQGYLFSRPVSPDELRAIVGLGDGVGAETKQNIA